MNVRSGTETNEATLCNDLVENQTDFNHPDTTNIHTPGEGVWIKLTHNESLSVR